MLGSVGNSMEMIGYYAVAMPEREGGQLGSHIRGAHGKQSQYSVSYFSIVVEILQSDQRK